MREGNLEAHDFFRLLALCHTVMPEEKKEGECPLMEIFITAWCRAFKKEGYASHVLYLMIKLIFNDV